MSRRSRRSITFQLWVRLSAITVTFTVLALAVYAWIHINEHIEAGRAAAATHSDAMAAAAHRLGFTGTQPSDAEIAIARTLGIAAVEFLDADGTVIASLLGLQPDNVGTRLTTGDVSVPPSSMQSYDVRLDGDGFPAANLNPFRALRGGEFGLARTYDAEGVPTGTGVAAVRVVTAYHNVSGEALALLVRALLLGGGVLTVATSAMWFMLHYFVARPLSAYSATALAIAAGEPARLPDMGNDEFGNLGRAINGMADILRHQASVDPLTGLYNLRHFAHNIETLIQESRSRGEPLALVAFDVDDLKPVNDTYGHQSGDRALRMLAATLNLWAGLDYLCWRTGGDEFAAVIPGGDADAAHREATQLQQAVSAAAVNVPNGRINLAVSIGVAVYPDDGVTGTELLAVADRRMYEAKAGKGSAVPPTGIVA